MRPCPWISREAAPSRPEIAPEAPTTGTASRRSSEHEAQPRRAPRTPGRRRRTPARRAGPGPSAARPAARRRARATLFINTCAQLPCRNSEVTRTCQWPTASCAGVNARVFECRVGHRERLHRIERDQPHAEDHDGPGGVEHRLALTGRRAPRLCLGLVQYARLVTSSRNRPPPDPIADDGRGLDLEDTPFRGLAHALLDRGRTVLSWSGKAYVEYRTSKLVAAFAGAACLAFAGLAQAQTSNASASRAGYRAGNGRVERPGNRAVNPRCATRRQPVAVDGVDRCRRRPERSSPTPAPAASSTPCRASAPPAAPAIRRQSQRRHPGQVSTAIVRITPDQYRRGRRDFVAERGCHQCRSIHSAQVSGSSRCSASAASSSRPAPAPVAGTVGALCAADRRCTGRRQSDALFGGAGLRGRVRPRAQRQRAAHRDRPHRRLHRQGRSRRLGPQDHPGRLADGDERLRQGRRAAGRALRHLGLRAGAEVRQPQADLRPAGAGRPSARRLPPDHGRPGARLRLLRRWRHHRAELQHPLQRRQGGGRQRQQHRRESARSAARPT